MSPPKDFIQQRLYKRNKGLTLLKMGFSNVHIAQIVGVKSKTVGNWRNKMNHCNEVGSTNNKSPLGEELFIWYLMALHRGENVTSKMIKDKVVEIKRKRTGEERLPPKAKWINHWKRKYGLIGTTTTENQFIRYRSVPCEVPNSFGSRVFLAHTTEISLTDHYVPIPENAPAVELQSFAEQEAISDKDEKEIESLLWRCYKFQRREFDDAEGVGSTDNVKDETVSEDENEIVIEEVEVYATASEDSEESMSEDEENAEKDEVMRMKEGKKSHDDDDVIILENVKMETILVKSDNEE